MLREKIKRYKYPFYFYGIKLCISFKYQQKPYFFIRFQREISSLILRAKWFLLNCLTLQKFFWYKPGQITGKQETLTKNDF